jgi:hypothetical protein
LLEEAVPLPPRRTTVVTAVEDIPTWNAGWRESAFVRDVEEPRLKVRLKKLERLQTRLYQRYGTQWPKPLVDRFSDRSKALYDELDDMEGRREQSWFPDSLIAKIRTVTGVDDDRFPDLLESLWEALERLHRVRDDEKRGRPRLDDSQRRQLVRLSRAVTNFLIRSGPDVSHTQKLIGGWADGRLHGQSFSQVVKAMSVLGSELSMRVHRSQNSPKKGRPSNRVRDEFCVNVALALRATGALLTVYRDGRFARLLRLLLRAAGELVPADMLGIVRAAVKKAPRVDSTRQRRRTALAKFTQPRALDTKVRSR